MGHVGGSEYRDLKQDYLRGDLTYDEFLEIYRDPENYRVQDPYRNRSHIDEGP
ncbi:MAG: GH-E family nuclease [[Mycobacterium] stephanolepidis]